MLLAITDARDDPDALVIYAVVERSTNAWHPEDVDVFPQECRAHFSRSVFDDLPPGDAPESVLRSFLAEVSPDWTPIQ